MKKHKSRGFKILALRPLKGCDSKFLKVLKENEIYRLYNDYEFRLRDNKVYEIIHTPSSPSDLYNVKSIPVNISAIVGNNGSGKSSLSELFFAVVYNLSVISETLKFNDDIKIEDIDIKNQLADQLLLIRNLKVEVYIEIDDIKLCLKVDTSDEKTVNDIKNNVISYFTIVPPNDVKESREFKLDKLISNLKDFINKYFFYTVAINYSHYSLNSKQFGTWLNYLFHKNDAYQTPLVINPMRVQGNIDINTENDLVKQRLLSNLLEPIDKNENPKDSLRNLASGKIAYKFKLKVDSEKIETYKDRNDLSKITNIDECVSQLYYEYTGVDIIHVAEEPYLQEVKIYVRNKLIKICSKYERYKSFIKKNKFVNIDKLVEKICKDNSHTTFKIKQAINFLRHQHIPKVNGNKEFEVLIQDLSDLIPEVKNDSNDRYGRKLSTIELIPPSIFKIKIEFEKNGSFDDLSSGEKQKIQSMSTIVYHIMNINSVFDAGNDENDSFKYRFINILFDEVELYFHPDLQRTLIKDLLDYIGKINSQYLTHIEGINMCFATHSPFILSDILSANTLRLEKGEVIDYDPGLQTFGANVYDLLEDSFFMREGFVGGFAMNEIQTVINSLNEKDTLDKNQNLKDRINIIGEPFLKDKLESMYFEKYPSEYDKEKEIQLLKQKLKKLENG